MLPVLVPISVPRPTPLHNLCSFLQDAETWMYPGLLLLHNDIANSVLAYRHARIPGAEEKAQSYSPPYTGTMFPWESAFTGCVCVCFVPVCLCVCVFVCVGL